MPGHSRRYLLFALLLSGLATLGFHASGAEPRFPLLSMSLNDADDAPLAGYGWAAKGFIRVGHVGSNAYSIFDVADLQALGTNKIRADFPKGRREHIYEGPLLKDVLEAANVRGKTVIFRTLDGYRARIPLSDLISRGAVLAYGRDGRLFGLNDFGPVQLVFPRAERESLSEMSDEHWHWSVFHIVVE